MMNDSPENSEQENGSGAAPTAKSAERLMESGELHELALHYFANEFPRSDRHDCPDQVALLFEAQTGSLPDDDLRGHLFSCSNCFQVYRDALIARSKPESIHPKSFGWASGRARFNLRPSLVWAGAVALLCVITFFGYTWWRTVTPRLGSLSAEQTISSTTSVSKTAVVPIESPPARTNVSTLQRPLEVPDTVATLNIDLNDYVVLRDLTADKGNEKVITLSPKLARLHLRLPEGSSAGKYEVALLDDNNRLVAPAQVVPAKGDSLVVTLDLRKVAVKNYRLRLRHEGESPDVYSVRIARE